jgi:hypothetical protein
MSGVKSSLLLLFTAFVVFVGAMPAQAFDADTKREIEYLIRAVELSGARFIRNGKEYAAAEGAAHLREKLQGAGDRVKTTEDFVDGVASKSLMSGKPYLIVIPGGAPTPVGPWLRTKLESYRETKRAGKD